MIVLSGPSGVGKGAVVAALLERLPGLTLSVSVTTRPRRPAEEPGRHYRFVDPAAFGRMAAAGELLESADVFGHRYGTPRGPVERALADGRNVLLELDVAGARQVRRSVPGAYLIFLQPPSLAELERRLLLRSTETVAQLRRRLDRAQSEISAAPEFDVVVTNDTVERTANRIVELIRRLPVPPPVS